MQSIQAHLAKQKVIVKRGKTTRSHVYSTDKIVINKHNWIKSVHMNSEINGYYTYYLATLHESKFILMSLSFDKSQVQKHAQLIQNTSNSLKLIQSNFFNQSPGNLTQPQMPTVVPPQRSKLLTAKNLLFLAILMTFIITIIAFFPRKKQRRKNFIHNKRHK